MATPSQRGRASPRSRAPHSSLRSAAGCRTACPGASRADPRTQHPRQPPGHRPHQTRRSRWSGTGSRPHRRPSRASRAPSSSWWGVERSEAGPAARSEVQAWGGVGGPGAEWGPPLPGPSSEHWAVQVRGREPCSEGQAQPCSPIPTMCWVPTNTEPGCFPPRAPVLTWTPFCFSPGHYHPSQTPLAPGLISVEGGVSPRGRAHPRVQWPFLALGPRTWTIGPPPPHMQSQAYHHPKRPAASHQGHRVEEGTALQGAGGPRVTCSCTLAGPRQGATLWAGAGKRSFVHKQRHRRCPQDPGPMPWSTSWHPPIPCQLTPMGPLVPTRPPPPPPPRH